MSLLGRGGATAWIGVAAAVIASVCVAGPASALTLGSSLEDAYEATYGGSGLTVYQEAALGETLTAPSPGTITSWSVRSADMGAKYELRILQPAAGGAFTAVGTSALETIEKSEDRKWGPFAVSLTVKTGDRIALDVVGGLGAPINLLAPLGGELNYFTDPFEDGTTESPILPPPAGGNQELLLQATFLAGPPANTSLPTIKGEARVGTALTGNEGSWENAEAFVFQWQRCLGETCSPIAGATGTSYTPTTADEGQQLRLEVTATGPGGKTGKALSERTNGVKAGPPVGPASTGVPVITGEAREPEQLIGTAGYWTGNPTAFQYQWFRCSTPSGTECEPIAGATATSYTVAHADVGATLRLRVTAESPYGVASAESRPTGIVQPFVVKPSFTISPNPSCTAVPTVLDAHATKTPDPPILSYTFVAVPIPSIAVLGAAFGGPEAFEEFLAHQPRETIASGSNPSPSVTFGFNREYEDELDAFFGPRVTAWEYVRDPVRITLTVVDKAGASASTTRELIFAQTYSARSRAGCPHFTTVVTKAFRFEPPSKFKVSGKLVTQTIRCTAAIPCAGTISIVTQRAIAASAGKRRKATPKQVVIAGDHFVRVAPHRTARISVKLTNAGRSLLKRGRTVKSIVRLTSVGPTGEVIVRSYHVSLRRA